MILLPTLRSVRRLAFVTLSLLSVVGIWAGTAEAAGTRGSLGNPLREGDDWALQVDAVLLRGADLCNDPTGSVTAAVQIEGTEADLRALLVHIRYPDRKVQLPGSANDTSVAARIKASNGSAHLTANDMGGAVKLQATDPFVSLGDPPLEIEFDLCNGAKVSDTDFECRVEFVSDKTAAVLHGIKCSVDVP